LVALLGIAQRTIRAKFDYSKEGFSPRKLIPSNPKTLGDYLLLKRIEADLSQPELAQKAGVSERKVKAWEYDKLSPTEIEWQVLKAILPLKTMPRNLKANARV
jgi:DNA-binding transcriptional regulator YiaG